MKNFIKSTLLLAISGGALFSCDTQEAVEPKNEISSEVLAKVAQAGFDPHTVELSDRGGYFVERDIYLTDQTLDELLAPAHMPGNEQYSTNNLVAAPRVINIYIEDATAGGKKPSKNAFDALTVSAVDQAIGLYNAEGLSLTFQRVTDSKAADIEIIRLKGKDEARGVQGAAGFPDKKGNPFNLIQLSGILESRYGMGQDEISTIVAHEIGHCIGFRHTDYFDRSFSCGGSPSDEGDAGFGANHIPGTPTAAEEGSWMLSCNSGQFRPFTAADKTALDYLY